MRTYILRRMDDDLWQRVKVKALNEQTTIREVIERLLRAWLQS